jgi:hypothetical protein
MSASIFHLYELVSKPDSFFTALFAEKKTVQSVVLLLLVAVSSVISILLLSSRTPSSTLLYLFWGSGVLFILMLLYTIIFSSLFHFTAELLGNSGRIFSTFQLLCICAFPLALATPLSIIVKFLCVPALGLYIPLLLVLVAWCFILTIIALRVSYDIRTGEAVLVFISPFLILGALILFWTIAGILIITFVVHTHFAHLYPV